MKTILLFMTMLFGLLATPATTKSQTEKARYSRLSNSPPRVAFLVYGELKPESVGTCERAESGVVHGYEPYKIPVYRVGVASMTGRPAMLYFDTFESFADAENDGEVMEKALAAQMQKRLQELVSDNRIAITLRRDDLSCLWKSSPLLTGRFGVNNS